MKTSFLPKLQTYFSLVSLLIVILPLGGFYFTLKNQSQINVQLLEKLFSHAVHLEWIFRNDFKNSRFAESPDSIESKSDLPLFNQYRAYRSFVLESPTNIQTSATWELKRDLNKLKIGAQDSPFESLHRFLVQMPSSIKVQIDVFDIELNQVASRNRFLNYDLIHKYHSKFPAGNMFVESIYQPGKNESGFWGFLSDTYKLQMLYPLMLGKKVYGVIILSANAPASLSILERNRFAIPVFLISLLLLVLFTSKFGASWVISPISDLASQGRKVAGGETMKPLKSPRIKEIRDLSNSLSSMANQLLFQNQMLSLLTKSISHELKTPISSIKGSAELLEDHFETMEPKKRQSFIKMIQNDAFRLEELLTRLLDLAKTDLQKKASEAEDLDGSLKRISKVLEDKALPITVSIDTKTKHYSIPFWALETILTNLVENGYVHGKAAKPIKIQVAEIDGNIQIRVIDYGVPISTENRHKIFDPFFTTNRDSGGTGLGLTIIQNILHKFGGSIELEEPTDQSLGNIFRISLPQ